VVKRLIAVAVLLLVAAFAYPMAMQATWSPCTALEKQVFGAMLATLRGGEGEGPALLQAELDTEGRLAVSYIRHRHPDVPPVLGCTYAYWRNVVNGGVVVDPEWLPADLPSVRLPDLEELERAVKGSE
jgi:hypothetical protein